MSEYGFSLTRENSYVGIFCAVSFLVSIFTFHLTRFDSQPGQQAIAIHILAIMPRSKDNRTMKVGQLIEYDIRNIFLEISCSYIFIWCSKYGGETIPRPFSQMSILSISLEQ